MSICKLGIQLFTVNDEMQKDFEGTLRRIADLGFRGVEFSHLGLQGLPAQQVRSLLSELKLEPIGFHVGSIERLTKYLDEEIMTAKSVGCSTLLFSLMDPLYRKDEQAWLESITMFEQIAARCAEQGVRFCYHNHEFELLEQVGGQPALDALLSRGDLLAELDTCWVHYGGCNPVQYINKYNERIPLIHIKDMIRKEDGTAVTVELGTGEVDLPGIISASYRAGVEWLIYEQDYCQNPQLLAAENSIKWIKKNLVH